MQQCCFATMKQTGWKFDPKNANRRANTGQSTFIRNGKADDWVNHLTPSLALLIDQRAERTLRRFPDAERERIMRIVHSNGSGLKGSLKINLLDADTCTMLVSAEGDRVPWGIRIVAPGEPVEPGDEVRLHLRAGKADLAVAMRCVTWAAVNGVLDFRLEGFDTAGEDRFRAFCAGSAADEVTRSVAQPGKNVSA